MQQHAPTASNAVAGDDLSALAWVQGELRRTLEQAHKALRRYVREAESLGGSDVDAVDPAVLRTARVQLHQGVGALELVGLPVVAQVLRASEAAVQRMIAKPRLAKPAAVEAIERASFGVLDYLGRVLAGKALPPLALYPQYAAVQELAGAERVHPADLWSHDWQWRSLPADGRVRPHAADEAARGEMEALVLAMMRQGDPAAQRRMSDLCAELGAAADGESATLWQIAAAFFEAQAAGRVKPDVHTKRLASRLLSVLRSTLRGEPDAPDRLAQDLLFYCVRASLPQDTAATPRLSALQAVWPGDESARADYDTPRLGLFDPAVVQQARKRLGAAKDAWSAVSGGEQHRLPALGETFALLADSVQRLFPGGEALSAALQGASARCVEAQQAPAAPLAMEVATSLLYLDAVLEDGEFDQPELAERVRRLAQRVNDVGTGAEAEPLELWMEELYRRVSDRQTMGSVVQELRASLSEVEKQIDQYFRDTAKRELLIPVPGQLSSMRSVLSVLGMDQASQAVVHMRDDVDALAQTEVDPERAMQTGTFERLADNLGALSFLIDMLAVQPQMAKRLFRFDPATGVLSALMGQSERVSSFGGLPSFAPTTHDATADAAPDAAAPAPEPMPMLVLTPPAPPPAPAPAPTGTGLEDDAEMREIFLEEAREVVTNARQSLAGVADVPDDVAEITALRRAFHTLKGSSRMVGLKEFGEAAWGCEQLFNARLAQEPRMDADWQGFTAEALDHLADWVEAIAEGADAGRRAEPVVRAADALRLEGRRVPIGGAQAAPGEVAEVPSAPAPAPAMSLGERVPDLPTAADLELPAWGEPLPDVEALAAVEAAPVAADVEPSLADLDFRLDLETATEPTPEPAAEPAALESEPTADVPALDLDLEAATPQAEGAAAEELPALDLAELPDLGFDELPMPEVVEPDAPPTEPGPRVEAEPAAVAGETPAPEAVEAEAEAEADESEAAAAPLSLPEAQEPVPADESATETQPAPLAEAAADEQVKVVGPLRIAIPLFNIFLNESDEQSRRLGVELAEWTMESHKPVSDTAVALAHSLAGNSATVGFADLSLLARALEHALMRSHAFGRARDDETELFTEAADEIRRLLHQFAAGFLKPVNPLVMQRLAEHEKNQPTESPELRPELEPEDELEAEPPAVAPPAVSAFATADIEDELAEDGDEAIDVEDAIDRDLFPIFEEEAEELLPQLRARLADWVRHPSDASAPAACMRTLHTFKGGARLAGAMRLGEMAHRLETEIERLSAVDAAPPGEIERLLGRADAMATVLERLRAPAPEAPALPAAPAVAAEAAPEAAPEPVATEAVAPTEPEAEVEVEAEPTAEAPAEAPAPADMPAAVPARTIDWSRFAIDVEPLEAAAAAAEPAAVAASSATVRGRAPLLDRMVNQAGEVSITRARLESDMRSLQGSMVDLTENLDRLRRQLRDIELQAETQISSRMEAAKAASQSFDPLEMDRFTRFQELTRMMAESVNDVATVQRGLQRTLQSSEDELALQARLTRDLQDDLLRTRMVEFESLADRLYRVVRAAAKETGKAVRMDLVGGAIEVDRGVLERMVGPFEHLLRNSVAHGIESAERRRAAGKDETGAIHVTVQQEGNEVAVEVRDDGAGLDLARIRARALERGLLAAGASPGDDELAQLIFEPGFSTAESVSGLAGRGVGMDVVRAEVTSMGGRIETHTEAGRGTTFRLLLPLTTAVTQVVMLRVGTRRVAVPTTLVEIVRRLPTADVQASYASGEHRHGAVTMPFFWLGALLQAEGRGGSMEERSQTVVVLRSAAQHVAVHVDEVLGHQEVVVKNLGPQLSHLPGLAGITLLPSGEVATIYNPVALANVYGDEARRLMQAEPAAETPVAVVEEPEAAVAQAPLVMVVDDSLTVRRVTQRLLVREGYRVVLAKDGLEAVEKLAGERPSVLLSDIEMPRMDGFDLVRNVRADTRLHDLPVIMITSRIAQKHRDYAAELGVQHYLGKPYSEEELLALVARYAAATVAA